MKRGFTLIESLAVIAIIGILASLSIYVAVGFASRGRDARRKSDLTAIGLGFQARYEAKTCTNPNDVNKYPGRQLDWSSGDTHWKDVSVLSTLQDCGAFSEYLATIPLDTIDQPYRFDLSSTAGSVDGKHYRLITKLERQQDQVALERSKTIWHDSFGGNVANFPSGYNYIVGN